MIEEHLGEIILSALGIIALLIQRWGISRQFDNTRGQNQALRDLMAKNEVTTLAPPVRRRRQRVGLLPRAPTPLPFFPVDPKKEKPDA